MLAATLPVGVAVALCLAIGPRVPLGGDEPHYLFIADSPLTDHDLRLQNNYDRDAATSAIYGPIAPHVYQIPAGWSIPEGWWPYHGVGLPALVALPFAVGGLRGARVALCLFTGLMAVAFALWIGLMAGGGIAAWTVIGAMMSLPILFGAMQLYPDLPGGVVAAVLTCWLLTPPRDRQCAAGWPLFWLATGLLPWLHLKYLGATLVLATAGAVTAWETRRQGDVTSARLAARTLPLVAVGMVLLAFWHHSVSGSILGFRRTTTELTDSPGRALMIFLGLHLDQSQGMFFAQPLLLAGVGCLVPFVRARPWTALFWAALYLSLIVPNSMELARYGLGGPAGRFGWSAMWLWLVPIAFMLATYRSRAEPIVKALAIAGCVYQAMLALRWIPVPGVLWTNIDDPGSSVFPPVLSRWLPSFATWDFVSYVHNPANQGAMVAVLAVLIAGAWLDADPRPMASSKI